MLNDMPERKPFSQDNPNTSLQPLSFSQVQFHLQPLLRLSWHSSFNLAFTSTSWTGNTDLNSGVLETSNKINVGGGCRALSRECTPCYLEYLQKKWSWVTMACICSWDVSPLYSFLVEFIFDSKIAIVDVNPTWQTKSHWEAETHGLKLET